MKKKLEGIGLVLGASAAMAGGFAAITHNLHFDCSKSVDPEIKTKMAQLKSCIDSNGYVDELHRSITAGDSGPERSASLSYHGVTFRAHTGVNGFEEPYTSFNDLHGALVLKDECSDGTADFKDNISQAEYGHMIEAFLEDCKQSNHEVPVQDYECKAQANLSSNAIDDFGSTVVELFNSELGGNCTGFVVDLNGEKLVLTAAHCLTRERCEPSSGVGGHDCEVVRSVYVAWPDGKNRASVDSFYYTMGIPLPSFLINRERDYASINDWGVVKLSPEANQMLVPFSIGTLKHDETAAFRTVGHGSDVDYSSVDFDRVEIKRSGLQIFNSAPNCHINPGHSGAPIFDVSTGVAEGILVASTIDPDSHSTYAVPIQRAAEQWTAHLDRAYQLIEKWQNRATKADIRLFQTSTMDRSAVVLTPHGYQLSMVPEMPFEETQSVHHSK